MFCVFGQIKLCNLDCFNFATSQCHHENIFIHWSLVTGQVNLISKCPCILSKNLLPTENTKFCALRHLFLDPDENAAKSFSVTHLYLNINKYFQTNRIVMLHESCQKWTHFISHLIIRSSAEHFFYEQCSSFFREQCSTCSENFMIQNIQITRFTEELWTIQGD